MTGNDLDVLTRRRMLRLLGATGVALPGIAALPKGSLTAGLAAAAADDCGSPDDHGTRDYLWQRVKKCAKNPPGDCLAVDSGAGYAVLHGGQGVKTDFLLVPTVRIKGIECPKIWQSGAPNYWDLAWEQARRHLPKGTSIALGINSVKARREDQLHIHMAAIQPQVKSTLGKSSDIALTPQKWKGSAVTVLGRTYRVLDVPDLGTNLFALLQQYVATNDMGEQMLVVTRQQQGRYWVLNSQTGIHGGTGLCDLLLDYG